MIPSLVVFNFIHKFSKRKFPKIQMKGKQNKREANYCKVFVERQTITKKCTKKNSKN